MNRREALAGLGATGTAAIARAASGQGAAAPLRLVASQLTQGGWARGVAAPGLGVLFQGQAVPTDPRGAFFVAFDRDAGRSATIEARDGHGRAFSLPLTISPRSWQIERIPIGPKPGAMPSEEFRIRREAELARIEAARSRDTGSQGWSEHFVWPVHGRISGRFGSQRIYNGTPAAYHSGLDIAGASGTPIAAPAEGTVILAASQSFTLEGHLLMVDHGMNLNSAFLHCSQLLVGEGERVRQGQVIAKVGMTGRATGPHLHWSIKWREARLDPLLFVGAA